jgi:Protein kinase domain
MAAKLSPGTIVAGFRVESSLGHGAMAEVYRACDENGRIVALKLLDDTLARDERFRQRFLRESQLASSLDDPHIVRTISSGEADGRLYLAMDLVDGSDLRQLLRDEGRLEPERAVALVEQVAGALDTAHAAGLVHRDVKPGNILVATAEDGERAYVCDFGLARHVSSVSSLTGDRGFVGTIDYVPPEQIEGGSIDGRADVYSLGCVLYECLAGVRPYDRDSELSVVFAHLNEPPPRVTDVRPELPAAFDEVCATALAKSPDDRYSSCGELATAARAALHGEVLARRRSHGRRVAVVVVATVLIAAAAVAGFLLTRKSHSAAPVTITPTTLAGSKLGDSSTFLQGLWGNGYQKLSMSFPPDYSVLTYRGREVSAYFAGTTDKAVQITTWNSAARTAEGIGPCSTLAELKKAYGTRLKPSPNNHTPAGVPLGYSLGKHMYFALGPGTIPKVVETVALFSNPISSAGFNASNDGPCAPGVDPIAVTRPKNTSTSTIAAPALRTTFTSHAFVPRLTVRTPSGWSVRSDNAHAFSLASANGTLIGFWLDPFAAAPSGTALTNVSQTPNGLVRWLQRAKPIVVSTPNSTLLGRPALTVATVDVRPRSSGVTYLTFRGHGYAFPLRAVPGKPARLFLTSVRIGTLVHTLAFAIQSPSQATFDAALPAATTILSGMRVAAAPVLPLSPFSSFCTPVFYGTCVGELTAGTHKSTTFQPALTYTVPLGWTNFIDHPGIFGFVPPGGDWQAVDSARSDYLDVFTSIATAREGCAQGASKIRTPAAFARWLAHEPGLTITHPASVTIGGLSGYVVDIRMRKGWTKPCFFSHGTPVAQVLTGVLPTDPGLAHGMVPQPMVMRLYLLNYERGTLGIEVDEVSGDAKLPAYSAVVKTFRFSLS